MKVRSDPIVAVSMQMWHLARSIFISDMHPLCELQAAVLCTVAGRCYTFTSLNNTVKAIIAVTPLFPLLIQTPTIGQRFHLAGLERMLRA